MEAVLATAIGILVASGVWLLLRPRTFQVIVGLALLSYGVNLFIFSMGRLWSGAPPILTGDGAVADPLPQALVLTAIVIGFATTGFVIEMALRSRHEGGSDHVDGRPDASATPPGVAAAGHSAALASDNPPDPRAAAGVGRGAPQEAGR